MCECSAKTAAIYSKKIIRRQQFFEEIAAGDCNTFVSVTPWETAVIGVSFSDTYGSEGKVSQPASLKFLKTRWQGHPIQALA